MTKEALKSAILKYLDTQPLLPAKNPAPSNKAQADQYYFSIIAGVRSNFAELKIHLAVHPEYFTSMQYAKSQNFSLSNFFENGQLAKDKVKAITELLREISIAQVLPPESNCIPYVLISENEGSSEFYETKTHFCGLAGTSETNFENIFFGISAKGLRNEIIAIGEKHVIAVSVDNSDKDMIAAAGLTEQFKNVSFGNVTFMEEKSLVTVNKSKSWLTVTKADGQVTKWQSKG